MSFQLFFLAILSKSPINLKLCFLSPIIPKLFPITYDKHDHIILKYGLKFDCSIRVSNCSIRISSTFKLDRFQAILTVHCKKYMQHCTNYSYPLCQPNSFQCLLFPKLFQHDRRNQRTTPQHFILF